MIAFRTTPVEQYPLPGTAAVMSVKREDLCAAPPMPPLAKMRGVSRFMSTLQAKGVREFGVMDTRVSKSGLGVAVIAEALGCACRYYFPLRRGESWETPTRLLAQEHGAQITPLPAGRIGILYARAACREPGYMLPLGFPLYETVEATAEEMQPTDPATYAGGTLAVAVGTGTILAGLLAGLLLVREWPKVVLGVTASMDPKRAARRAACHLRRFVDERRIDPARARQLLARVQLVKEGTDYYAPGDPSPYAFPVHPTYEAKALAWMARHDLVQPVLFWNVGA